MVGSKIAESLLTDYRIDLIPLAYLKPHSRNARAHSKKQIQSLARSIETFGFVKPVVIDADNTILAGHGVTEAAKSIGLKRVPVIRIEHLDETDKRAFVLADNQLATKSNWDRDLLALELSELGELGFDIELTGFETAEVDLLIGEHEATTAEAPDPEDAVARVEPDRPIVAQPGDAWILGDHRLVCGDARDSSVYRTLLGEETARMAITDPPYNVPIQGHVSGLGRVRHREFAMAAGEMTGPAFTFFLETVFRNMAAISGRGALQYVFSDWRHLPEMLTAGNSVYDAQINLCVWDKGTGGMGSFYRSQHELVLVWKTGTGPHLNNIELGRHGRTRTNIWSYRGINQFGKERDALLAMHPTVKPVAMIADPILDCTRRHDLVLDPFCGSGTILIAAQKTGRRARAIEIDPSYCDTAVRRWQAYTGKSAIHAETELTFEEVAEARDNEVAAGEVS